MAKKLSELRKGDKVYIISEWGERIEVCDIWKDSCQQSTLSFPRYCHVNYVRNSDKCHMQSSVDGTKSVSYNGGWYFTEYDEARVFLLDKLREKLEKGESRAEVTLKSNDHLRRLINQLEGGRIEEENPKTCSRHLR